MGGGWTGMAPDGSSAGSPGRPGSPRKSGRTRSGTHSLCLVVVLRLAASWLVVTGLGLAKACVVFLRSIPMILSFFASQGWESWDLERRPLLPERMPVLIDDDLRFEDGPGA